MLVEWHQAMKNGVKSGLRPRLDSAEETQTSSSPARLGAWKCRTWCFISGNTVLILLSADAGKIQINAWICLVLWLQIILLFIQIFVKYGDFCSLSHLVHICSWCGGLHLSFFGKRFFWKLGDFSPGEQGWDQRGKEKKIRFRL